MQERWWKFMEKRFAFDMRGKWKWKKGKFYGHSCLLLDAMMFKRFLDGKLVVIRISVSRHRFLKYVYLHDDNGKKCPRQLKSCDEFCSFYLFCRTAAFNSCHGMNERLAEKCEALTCATNHISYTLSSDSMHEVLRIFMTYLLPFDVCSLIIFISQS